MILRAKRIIFSIIFVYRIISLALSLSIEDLCFGEMIHICLCQGYSGYVHHLQR